MMAKQFGVRLRQLRQQAGLTQRELAERVGIDFTYLSKIESGAMPPPSEKVILRLAEALHADRDELMTLAGKIPADIAELLKNPETLQFLRSGRTQQKSGLLIRGREVRTMKNLVNKRFSKVAVALALTLAIAASLWFSVPAKAIFVTSTIPSSMTADSTYSFDVQIDIEAGEAVNIDNIKLIIFDSNGVPVRLAFFTPDGNVYWEQPSGYVVGVTRILPGYSGTSNLYAYGYGYHVTAGFGYHTYDPGVGAGYGYGEGSPNTTQLKYRITIRTTGMAAGSYKALVAVEVSSTLSFTSQYYPLTITSAPAAPAAQPGVTDVSGSVDANGVFTRSVTAKSANNEVSVNINQGIKGLTAESRRITEISITPMAAADVPAPPAGGNVIGLAYNFGPSGATFSDDVTITFTYDPDDLPEGVNEEDLVIAVWDEDAGEWVELPSVVDTENNIITATVDHFTPFAIIALPVEEEEVVPPVVEEEEEVVPPVVEEEEEIAPPVVEEEEGIGWWVWLVVGLASAAVVGLLVYFLWWRQRLA